MENTEQENNKIAIAARVEPAVFNAIERLAKADERTLSFMIERLLKQSPPIQQMLEGETAGAQA